MAKFNITQTTTVAELKSQFSQEIGGVLRIYEGRSEASEAATLVSLGATPKEWECRTSRTVGSFEKAFQDEINLKVKVYTRDNWVKVLDDITLETASKLPNGMTKAKMEAYVSNYATPNRKPKEEKCEVNIPADKLKLVHKDGKWGFVDTKGNYLIEPKYDSIGYFYDGFASVKLNGKYGVINQEGKIVIDLKYDGVRVGKIVETTLDFKKGFIDLEQNIVVEPKFDDLWDFSEELCGACINDKWGYINKQGVFVIEPKFDEVGNFKNGIDVVVFKGKCGVINIQGEFVIEPKFKSMSTEYNGHFKVLLDDKWGLIDERGNWLVPATYDSRWDVPEVDDK